MCWISIVSSHYWQRRLMFPTTSNCLKGIQYFLMQLIEIPYLLFSCDQKQDFVSLLNGQCQKNPFLRTWRQRKVFLSLDIIGWTMINHPVCKLELTLKFDEGKKGSVLIKSIFHLSYFFIRRGKIKCYHPIFVVTMINFIKTISGKAFPT